MTYDNKVHLLKRDMYQILADHNQERGSHAARLADLGEKIEGMATELAFTDFRDQKISRRDLLATKDSYVIKLASAAGVLPHL